jgi:hypothetical protein
MTVDSRGGRAYLLRPTDLMLPSASTRQTTDATKVVAVVVRLDLRVLLITRGGPVI